MRVEGMRVEGTKLGYCRCMVYGVWCMVMRMRERLRDGVVVARKQRDGEEREERISDQ